VLWIPAIGAVGHKLPVQIASLTNCRLPGGTSSTPERCSSTGDSATGRGALRLDFGPRRGPTSHDLSLRTLGGPVTVIVAESQALEVHPACDSPAVARGRVTATLTFSTRNPDRPASVTFILSVCPPTLPAPGCRPQASEPCDSRCRCPGPCCGEFCKVFRTVMPLITLQGHGTPAGSEESVRRTPAVRRDAALIVGKVHGQVALPFSAVSTRSGPSCGRVPTVHRPEQPVILRVPCVEWQTGSPRVRKGASLLSPAIPLEASMKPLPEWHSRQAERLDRDQS